MDEAKNTSLTKKILKIIIIAIATLVLVFTVIIAWLLVKNPLNVRGILLYKLGWTDKPVMIVPVNTDSGSSSTTDTTSTNDINPAPDAPDTAAGTPAETLPLTPSQRQAAENFGIDPNSIVITPAMEACFIDKLGAERVNEIKNGAAPNAMDFFRAGSCL